MSNNDRNMDMKELQKGIQMVLEAFNEQKEQYIKIINSLKERIKSLEMEMIKLKEENNLYQNKLFTLQKNIKNISKTICQIKDDEDEESIIEEKNNSDLDKSVKNNLSEEEENLKIKLIKKGNNDYFKRHSLNKLEMKKPIKNKENQELNNNYFKDIINYSSRDNDIQIKKKEKDINYMKNLYQALNNNKIKNKKNANKLGKKEIDYNENDYIDNIKDIELKNDNENDKEVNEISSYSNRNDN